MCIATLTRETDLAPKSCDAALEGEAPADLLAASGGPVLPELLQAGARALHAVGLLHLS